MTEGLFYRDQAGEEHPLKEISGLTGNGAIIIILRAGTTMNFFEREWRERDIAEKLNVERVVILDDSIEKIMRIDQ